MYHEIESQWMGDMQFNALVDGHTLTMDGPEKVGGHNIGPIPKPLVLTALSGCTGMDVVSLLRKAGCKLRHFDVKVRGELSPGHPIQYTSIHLDYLAEGLNEDMDELLRAVRLSQEQYCGVSAMLKKIMPVTWSVVYNGHLVFSNQPVGQRAS